MRKNHDAKDKNVKSASIVLLCGLPASGKSTIASLMKESMKCDDSYRGDGNDSDNDDTIDETKTFFDKVILIDYDEITKKEFYEMQILNREKINSIETSATIADSNLCNGKSQNDSVSSFFTELERSAWRKARLTALEILQQNLENHFHPNPHPNPHPHEHINQSEPLKKQEKLEINRLLIIMDDNFHLRSMRREVYKICQRYVLWQPDLKGTHINEEDMYTNRISFTIVVVDVPMRICLERNALREGNNRVPDHVITKMARSIEFPSIPKKTKEEEEPNIDILNKNSGRNKLHDESSICALTNIFEKDQKRLQKLHDAQNCDNAPTKGKLYPSFHSIILQTIKSNLENNPISPPPSKEEEDLLYQQLLAERAKTMKNILHVVDQLLRQFVRITCQTNKDWAKKANMGRKKILNDIRQYQQMDQNNYQISNMKMVEDVMTTVWEQYESLFMDQDRMNNFIAGGDATLNDLSQKLKNVYEQFLSKQKSIHNS